MEPKPFTELSLPELKKLCTHGVAIQVLAVVWILLALGLGAVSYAILTREHDLINMAISIFFIIWGLTFLLSAFGLLLRYAWARYCGMFLCVSVIWTFPIGTAIGVTGLLSLAGSERLFGSGKYDLAGLYAEYHRRRELGS